MKTIPDYPARQKETRELLKTLLFAIVMFAIVLLATSCALPDTEGANPLDRPYDLQSAAKIREGHIQKITSNPAYRLP